MANRQGRQSAMTGDFLRAGRIRRSCSLSGADFFFERLRCKTQSRAGMRSPGGLRRRADGKKSGDTALLNCLFRELSDTASHTIGGRCAGQGVSLGENRFMVCPWNSGRIPAFHPISAMPLPAPDSRDPLHGITLENIVTQLHAQFGWEEMGRRIPIRCFLHDPSIKSSLTFLRKTPWARQKVETWFLHEFWYKERP